MKFDVQKAVDYILDERNPRRVRAIELFAFLVALHVGYSHGQVSGRRGARQINVVLDVSEGKLRAARMHAAMSMLDQLETDWVANNKGQEPTLERMAKVEGYEEIYNQIVLRNGGWHSVRRMQGIEDLEDDLEEPRRSARNVARIIEFSCQFIPNPSKPKQLGGVTMATDIVTCTRYFDVEVKDSTLEEWWSNQQSAAPFFYLIYVQKYPLFLNKIVSSRFAQRYLARIDDRPTLLDFFSAYNSVVQQLRRRGYNYTLLQLPDFSMTTSLNFCPFRKRNREEREVLDAIENYRT